MHIVPPADLPQGDSSDRYLWRFLNHSCRPNAAIVNRVLVARTAIPAGAEVTFDYNTTEYEIAAPFKCGCGHCEGAEIRGAKYLSTAERQNRGQSLACHLRDDEVPNV